jgi:hypothetical protein
MQTQDSTPDPWHRLQGTHASGYHPSIAEDMVWIVMGSVSAEDEVGGIG